MFVGAAALARTAFGIALVAAAAPAPSPGPFDAALAGARARLEARHGRPEAIAPLVELLALEDNLPPGALAPALRRAAAAGSHPLVAAQATFHLARLLDDAGDADGARAAGAASCAARLSIKTRPRRGCGRGGTASSSRPRSPTGPGGCTCA